MRHVAACHETNEPEIKSFVLSAADFALAKLGESIEDDSMYCLFQWDEETSLLTIQVTDASKEKEGKHVIQVHLSMFEQANIEDKTETLKFWLRDHLTTSADFLKFSLVAGFTRNARLTVELM